MLLEWAEVSGAGQVFRVQDVTAPVDLLQR